MVFIEDVMTDDVVVNEEAVIVNEEAIVIDEAVVISKEEKQELQGQENVFGDNFVEGEDDSYCDVDDNDLILMLIIRLKELDAKARLDDENYKTCKHVIKELCNYIENEYGFECLIDVIRVASDELGHPLAPIDRSIAKKLVKEGWIIDKGTKEVRVISDEELINLFETKSKNKKKLISK